MKYLLLFLLFIIGFGCEEERPDYTTKPSVSNTVEYGSEYRDRKIISIVMEIEGCQYVVVSHVNGISVVHKQNCKYCTNVEKENKNISVK
jgi:hypothetical protein